MQLDEMVSGLRQRSITFPSFGRTTDENKQDIYPEQPNSEANIQNQNHPIILV